MTDKTSAYFGFSDRLPEEFPSQIVVDTTEVCNLACIHCPHPEFKKSAHYSGGHLPPELNQKMVDEVRTSGKGKTKYIRYTGNGEPLVHPHIYEMLAYAVENAGVPVTLTTNGKIMNETRVRSLLASGLHLIDISIDAMKPETYAKIRVGGKLEGTTSNVKKLISMRKEENAKTKIIVSFVEQAFNKGEADEFKKYWHSEGADEVIIRRQHSAAGAVKIIADSLKKESKVERYPCLYPWERILLNPRGELAFCPQDWTHDSAITDYRATTIKEAWQGEFYKKLRQAHLSNNYSGCEFCGKCPDWQQTRWPFQGRSYADLVQELFY